MFCPAYTITLLGNEYYIVMHDVTSRVNQSMLKICYNKLELLVDKKLEENSEFSVVNYEEVYLLNKRRFWRMNTQSTERCSFSNQATQTSIL